MLCPQLLCELKLWEINGDKVHRAVYEEEDAQTGEPRAKMDAKWPERRDT